jgi:hypothetical protein
MSKRQRSDEYSSEPKTHLITDINEMDELLKEEDVKIGDRIKLTGLNQELEDNKKPMYYIVKCEKKSVELVVPEEHEEEEDEIYGGKNKRRINRVRKSKSIKKIRTNRHRTIRHRKTTRRVKKTIRRK